MPPSSPQPDAARLDALLASNEHIIPYMENVADREFPFVTLSVYGATETNELFLSLTNGRIRFVEVIESPVFFPVMADRIFGIDVLDSHAALSHADQMWEKHKAELLQK
jgi:hypothetical protein